MSIFSPFDKKIGKIIIYFSFVACNLDYLWYNYSKRCLDDTFGDLRRSKSFANKELG